MRTGLRNFRKQLLVFSCILLCLAISQKSFSQGDIVPQSEAGFTGGSTVCQGATAPDLLFDINTVTCGTFPFSPIDIIVTWYANPVNSTTGGTQVAQQILTSSTTSFNYTPSSFSTGTLYYYVEVSWGSLTCATPGSFISSITQSVTVNAVPASAVSISASSATICSGMLVTFTAAPTNGGISPSYQWQVNGINQGTDNPVFTSSALANGDMVTVIMTPVAADCISADPVTSNTINMTVFALQPASVSISASATTICEGSSVTFTAAPVNGGASVSYQWKVNGINAGTDSPVFTTTTLINGDVVTVEMTADPGDCTSGSPATSNDILMTVNALQPVSVTIASSATTICTGTAVTFTATPVNGGVSPAYQWKVNGINSGTNSNAFTTSTLSSGDVVTVELTSTITPCATGNPATSNAIVMTVNPILTAGVSIAASATTICSGTLVTFTATPVNGGSSASYQWKVNGGNVGTNSPVFTSTTLVTGNSVTVVMTSNASPCLTGSPVTSNALVMTVNPIPTALVMTPSGATICQGAIQSLNAVSGTTTTFSTGTISVGIPDNIATGASSTIGMGGIPAGAVVNSVSVTFNINHTNVGDLVVNLRAPNTNILNLANRDGGTGNDFINTVVSSTGAATVSTGAAPFTATFLPDGIIGVGPTASVSNVALFSSLFSVANGNWVLSVRDASGGTSGTITGWSLSINWGYPITWSPITDLYSNAGATVPYNNGQVLSTVYLNPSTAGSPVYTATATHPNGCTRSNAVTVTVNPRPTVSASPASQSKCTGSPITQIDITNPNTVAGTVFTWTRTTPAGLAGIAASGSGPAISGTFTNSTAAAITTTFTITATAGTCSSTTTVTVTVNPIPTINVTNTNQTVCGLITNMVITNPNGVAGTVFDWTRDNTVNLTGIAASGTGSPVSGTFINNTNVQQITIFTIAASLAGCSTSTTATVTVNPKPTVNATPSTQTICSAAAIGQIDITNPNAVAGTVFSWTRDNTVNLTGMAASGTGTPVNGNLTNNTAVQQTTIFTITATAGSCSSTTTVNVKVNPTPVVNAIANQAFCQNQNGSAVVFGSNVAGSAFSWTSTANVGFGTSGNGNIPAYVATNSPVTATVSVTPTASGCPGPVRTFTITVNPLPSVTISADYCLVPGKVRLTANPLPAGSYTYLWTNGATTSFIDVDIAGSYGVTVTNSNGCKATNSISVATELAVNGDFEAGNTGFTSGYTYDPSANGLFAPEGKYAVNNTPNFNHTGFYGTDHTTGTGKMMIINGIVGPTVWQETVTVVPNTTYYFSAWALSMNNVSPFAQLQFKVNGSVIGVSAVLVAGVNNNASNTNWQRFYGTWSSGPLTSATCSIVDLQGALGGNDFALDDISISTLSPAPFFALPSVLGGGTSVCQGSTLNLAANLSGGSSPYIFSWTGPAGFTSSLQNPSIPSATAANSGTYTINVTDFYGCVITSSRVITVAAPPAAPSPVTATPATICIGSNSNLNGTTPTGTQADFTGFYATANWAITNNPGLTGGSVNLAFTPTVVAITSGNNSVANGNTDFTITNGPVAGNFTFNWSYTTTTDLPANDIPQYSVNGGAGVNLPGFSTAPAAISQSGTASIAVPANQTFTLRMRTLNGTLGASTVRIYNFTAPIIGNIAWYNVSTGGTVFGTTASTVNFNVTPPAVGTNTYYAEAISPIGCVGSARTPVSITVNQSSAAATGLTASPNVICNGSSSTLTQTGGSLGTGASWKWYSNNTYTTLAGTGTGANASLTVSPAVTTTYYLRIEGTASPCTANITGPAAGVTVTVNQPSVASTSLNASVNPTCRGNNTTLTQTGGSLGTGASWKWYSDASYTTFVGNGTGASASLVVSPLVTTTYYLRSEGGSAPCTAITAGPVAGITITVNQPSAAATTLTASPNVICNGSSSTLTQTGGSLGTGASWKWYSNNTYTTLVGTGTGANASLTVSPLVTTTYYLRAEGATSPCTANVTGPVAGVTVTVNQPSVASTGLNASVNPTCRGNNTTLTQTGGSLGTGASWKWYSDASYTTFVGNGTGTSASLVVSPLVTTTYYLRSEGGSAPCTAITAGPVAGITVTVNQPSAAATGLTASPNVICNGSSSTLTQTGGSLGTGASWKWYSNNTYTTLVGTGTGANASLTVSPLVTTTYYLRAEGATSPCTANVTGPVAGVTVTVNQPSVAATNLAATPLVICEGSSSTLTQTGGSLGTGASWKWYSDASYTTLVGTGAGATASLAVSPLLTTTYYLRSEGGASPCTANVTGPVAGITVTVNKKSANPTSVNALPAGICEGSSAVLSLGGGGLGTGETIVWYTGSCGGTIAGTGNNLSVSPLVTTTYYGRYENGAPCNFNTSCLQVTVNVTKAGTWLGVTTNWHNASNWCGGVPNGSTNVIIPVVGSGKYPNINSSDAIAHDVTMAAGTSLTVHHQTLQVGGTITNNGGSFDVTDGLLELNGSGIAQNISGSVFLDNTIKDLRISNSSGVNITGTNDTLKLSGLLKFGVSNATLNTNNNLTLLSTQQHTASVGDMTNNGFNSNNNIIGNVTVERYIPNHFKAWQFLAAPTSGQTVNAAWQEGNAPLSNSNNPGYGTIITSNNSGAVALGFDVYTPAGPTMKTYDSASNGWIGIANPGIQISNKKGYMLFVRGDRSVTAFNQPATATVLRTTGKLYTQGADAPPVTNLDANTFESIGNPYASAIDFDKVTKSGGVQDLFYVWDPKLTTSTYSAWGLGAYQTIIGPGPNYTVVPGGGSYNGPNPGTNIESGQAFFVHAPFTAGSVSFTETAKVDGSCLVTRPANNEVTQLRNNLYVMISGDPVLLDGTLSQFDGAYSSSIDAMDVTKFNNNSENLGIMREGKKLVAERRAEIQLNDTIFYNLGQLRVQQYRFEFIPSHFDQPGIVAFMEDKYLHTTTVLNMHDTTRVMFNIINDPGSYAADRFKVVFKRPAPVPVTFTAIAASRNNDKTVTVNWKVDNEINIQRYTVERSADGRNFTGIITKDPLTNNGSSQFYAENDLAALSTDNFYRIKALSLGGAIQYSAVVKVGALKGKPGISVYPNPVTGHILQLQFTDQPAGKYSIVLVHSDGKQQSLSQVQVQASQAVYAIEIPQLLAAGIYRLQITGLGNEMTFKTIQVSE